MGILDIVLLVIIGASLILGFAIGIIRMIFTALGFVIAWWLAGQFADDIGSLAGDSTMLDSILSVSSYAVIIVVSATAASMLGVFVNKFLTIATLGLSRIADKVCGVALGLLMGLVISFALITFMARLAFDFTVTISEVVVPGMETVTLAEETEVEVAAIETQRQTLIDSLANSRIVAVFIDIRDILPGSVLGFVPDDFDAGLEILKEKM